MPSLSFLPVIIVYINSVLNTFIDLLTTSVSLTHVYIMFLKLLVIANSSVANMFRIIAVEIVVIEHTDKLLMPFSLTMLLTNFSSPKCPSGEGLSIYQVRWR